MNSGAEGVNEWLLEVVRVVLDKPDDINQGTVVNVITYCDDNSNLADELELIDDDNILWINRVSYHQIYTALPL